MDIWSKRKRSTVMSRIRSADTKPELAVRRYLQAIGVRYRLHAKSLPGTPDIVVPSRRVAIFVHGCFWHQHHNCIDGRIPKSRRSYWLPKLRGNVRRDAAVAKRLRRKGWRVLRLWECKVERNPCRALAQLLRSIEARR